MTTTETKTAKHGYVIMYRVTGEIREHTHCPLSAAGAKAGEWEPAYLGYQPIAVWSTREAAEAAMQAMCGDSDPVIYAGAYVKAAANVIGVVQYPEWIERID